MSHLLVDYLEQDFGNESEDSDYEYNEEERLSDDEKYDPVDYEFVSDAEDDAVSDALIEQFSQMGINKREETILRKLHRYIEEYTEQIIASITYYNLFLSCLFMSVLYYIYYLSTQPKFYFCSSEEENYVLHLIYNHKEFCTPCPFRAVCEKGIATCSFGRKLRGIECIEPTKIEEAIYTIHEESSDLLAYQHGLYSCDRAESFRMHEEELFQTLQSMHEEDLYEPFELWRTRILLLTMGPNIKFIKPFFETDIVYKPLDCATIQFFKNYFISITCTSILLSFTLWYFIVQHRIYQENIDVENLISHIYNFLKKRKTEDLNQTIPIPIEDIKKIAAAKRESVWNRCVQLINRDACIQKSVRMLDGVQKNCWKISDTFVENDNNEDNDENTMNSTQKVTGGAYFTDEITDNNIMSAETTFAE